jgi:prophage regulatory protein
MMTTKNDRRSSPQLLSIRDVSAMTSLSRRTLYAKASDGTFPKPLKISKRRIAYRETDVRAWLEAQPQVQ